MEEQNKAIAGCIIFLVLILIIGVGGYFYAFRGTNHQSSTKETKESYEYKIDKKKDYIYYENENVVSQDLSLIYKDPIINLNNLQAKEISEELANENNAYLSEIKKISETQNDTGQEIVFDTGDIYSAIIRDYENYEYEQYISLVVTDSLYDCFQGIYNIKQIKSYIFNVKNNKKISNIDLLDMFSTNFTEVKNKIREQLEKEQTEYEEETIIDIEKTIENMSNESNYGLYIDQSGNLIIKYIVQTNKINYNESMIIS